MDRIDSMDAKEKDAALRVLLIAGQSILDGHENLKEHYSKMDALKSALAAFDPTPLDRAKAALEKEGFVRLADEVLRNSDIAIYAGGAPYIKQWFRAKESP